MRRSLWLLALGAVSLVVAGGWDPIMAPHLTAQPSDLLQLTSDYAGTYTGYVDERTGAPLPAPRSVPVTVTRKIEAVPGSSADGHLVVSKVTKLTMGGSSHSDTVHYLVDRSTGKGVTGPDAWALTADNTVDRSGSYLFGAPKDADPTKAYPIWQDEIGAAGKMTGRNSHRVINGVTTWRFGVDGGPTAMAPSYVAASKLPTSMAFATFAAGLRASGVDLAAATEALMPVLTTAERAKVMAAANTPIKLTYSLVTSSDVDVERSTGGIVDVARFRQEVTMKPDLASLAATLGPIVTAHAGQPVVQRLLPTMTMIASSNGQKIYTLEYAQTPSSVSATAHSVAASARTLKIVTFWVPVAAGVLGGLLIVLFLIGLLLSPARRSGLARLRGRAANQPTPAHEAAAEEVPAPRSAPDETSEPAQRLGQGPSA